MEKQQTGNDRRSGADTRTDVVKLIEGERRSGKDRRKRPKSSGAEKNPENLSPPQDPHA